MRDKSLPGPDGIGTVAPLVSTGLISPVDAGRTVAAFTGGFKRTHGAFAWGELATKNFGSHYGFMEQGVVESTLQPGLSTIYTLVDGRLEMKTWTEADRQLLPRNRLGPPERGPDHRLPRYDGRNVCPGAPRIPVGRGKLVRIGKQEAADAPGRGRPAGGRRKAFPPLRGLHQRHAVSHGPRLPGLSSAAMPCSWT